MSQKFKCWKFTKRLLNLIKREKIRQVMMKNNKIFSILVLQKKRNRESKVNWVLKSQLPNSKKLLRKLRKMVKLVQTKILI